MVAWIRLLDVEFKNFLSIHPSLYVVVYMHRTYSNGCSRKDKVSCFKSKETAYVTHKFVNWVYHVRAYTPLHGFSIYVQAEIYTLL